NPAGPCGTGLPSTPGLQASPPPQWPGPPGPTSAPATSPPAPPYRDPSCCTGPGKHPGECLQAPNYHAPLPAICVPLAVGQQFLQFPAEGLQVAELPVHRGEPHIRHFIHVAEALHDQLADKPAVHFPLETAAQFPLHVG